MKNATDKLVNQLTAFSSFAQMRECMVNGYVPTIFPNGKAHRKLINIIRAHGFRVWTGSNDVQAFN